MIEFMKRYEAISTAAVMRGKGWPKARATEREEGWVVTTHDRRCRCGRCPFLMTDGLIH